MSKSFITAKIQAKLTAGMSPEELIFYPIIWTLMLGAIYNGATNSITYSSSFTFQAVLNPHSPFTFLTSGNFVGFATGMFNPANQSTTPIIVSTTLNQGAIAFRTNCSLNGAFSPLVQYAFFGTVQVTNPHFVIRCDTPPNWTGATTTGGQLWFSCAPVYGTPNPTACNNMPLVSTANLNVAGTTERFSCSTSSTRGLRDAGVNICAQQDVVNANFAGILPFLLTLFSFLASAALIILSLGIRLDAQAASLGGTIASNQQGTRLAQSFGFGLLLWSITSSEFGVIWLGGVFPFGLGVIVYFVFIVMFMTGLWKRALSTSG